MRIEINVGTDGPHWVQSGWESTTTLREVVSEEPRALSARRVNAFGQVVETLNLSHRQIKEIDADLRNAR